MTLDIRPVFLREVVTATRKRSLWGARAFLATLLLSILLGAVAKQYFRDRRPDFEPSVLTQVGRQAFAWMLLAHACSLFGVVMGRAVPSIAAENERRTLDFLLATSLGNAEIVLGKLATCAAFLLSELAVGFPVLVFLHQLGGVDIGLIAVAYAGLLTTAYFVLAVSVWVSTRAPTIRGAVAAAVSWLGLWLIGPFCLANALPRLGIRLPSVLASINSWALHSGPLSLLQSIKAGATPTSGLIDAIVRMGERQLAAGTVLIVWSIVGLRSAYRRNVSGDYRSLAARLARPGWRWRPKRPVGDDPIFWRESQTSREAFLTKLVGFFVYLGLFGGLAYYTFFFAWPAVVEIWRHGYRSGITGVQHPEWNLVIRLMAIVEVSPPADLARVEFNVYLRYMSVPLVFLITMIASGLAAEGILRERTRETWESLIATPLTARDILRAFMLSSLWRSRILIATLLALWTIGLAAGAIHPVGFAVSLLLASAWTWFMLAFGVSISVSAKNSNETVAPNLSLTLLTAGSSVLPYLLPRALNSIVLGACSPPLMIWLALVSHREMRTALRYSVYPAIDWMRHANGESVLTVIATLAVSVIVPWLGGLYLWRRTLAKFDQKIGRPWKSNLLRSDTHSESSSDH